MISIIIPVYQVEKHLRKCLDSVISQTYKDLEIIIVDDGSTDSCGKMCDEYAENDSRIKVIHQKNQGLSAARNAGLDIANGDFIGFVDSKDYVKPSMFGKLYQAATENSADIAICNFQTICNSGKIQGHSSIDTWVGNGKEAVLNNIIRQNHIWNALYHKSIFQNIRFNIAKQYDEISTIHLAFWTVSKAIVIPDVEYTHQIQSPDTTHLDYCEGVLSRIVFLIHKNAFPETIHFWILQYCQIYTDLYRECKTKKNNQKKLNHLHHNFQKILQKSNKKKFTIYRNLVYMILSIYPPFYKYIISTNKFLQQTLNIFDFWKIYHNQNTQGLTKSILKKEFRKYINQWKKNAGKEITKTQIKAFFSDRINFLKDSTTTFSNNPCTPTIVVVEKNDLQRMQLFYKHYRNLGIHQFIVLDNGSTDGTLDFLKQQQDTKIYQTLEPFQTQRKEAWIQRILAQNGYDKWYIVVDSDELLDYIGSENHSIETLIRKMHDKGYRRLWGFMLDMYSRNNLFDTNCDIMDIPKRFNYFDKDSYFFENFNNQTKANSNALIYGGPRYRHFGLFAVQSKQSIFYFDKNTLYANCHYLAPKTSWGDVPCCFVLRHYKFLPQDKQEYENRIKNNSFYNNSVEYKDIMMQIERNPNGISFYYENSVLYENSDSLRCLPFLEVVL